MLLSSVIERDNSIVSEALCKVLEDLKAFISCFKYSSSSGNKASGLDNCLAQATSADG